MFKCLYQEYFALKINKNKLYSKWDTFGRKNAFIGNLHFKVGFYKIDFII